MWCFIILTVRLIVIFSVGQLTLLTGTKLVSQGDEQFDPLALYQDILPGAPMSALANYPCEWHIENVTGDVDSRCQVALSAQHFGNVEVFARGSLIQTLKFQAGHLRVGDLPQYWGAPIVANYTTHSLALWHVGVYDVRAFLPQGRQSNPLWTPIAYMTIWRGQRSN
jgi:hypothetical protein